MKKGEPAWFTEAVERLVAVVKETPQEHLGDLVVAMARAVVLAAPPLPVPGERCPCGAELWQDTGDDADERLLGALTGSAVLAPFDGAVCEHNFALGYDEARLYVDADGETAVESDCERTDQHSFAVSCGSCGRVFSPAGLDSGVDLGWARFIA